MKMKVIQQPRLPSKLELWASVPSIFQVNSCFQVAKGWLATPKCCGTPATPRGWQREAAAAYGGDGS
jgi:hypothetical protein